jgi:4-amino-4-deoxy-L-arabinose transferase-like glycosyltransferase
VTIALLALVACLTSARDVWPPDEPRYIRVAQEMVEDGNWLVPRLNGTLYTQKPPLFFWLLAISASAFGSWDRLVMIVPSICGAVGCLWVMLWFGAMSGRRGTGIRAAWILAGCLPFLFTAQLVRMDILLACTVAVAIACVFRLLVVGAKPPGTVLAGLYGALAAGTLIKGPVAVALPALATIVWLAREGGWRRLRQLRLEWGVPIYVGLVLAWAVPAAVEAGPAYVWHVLVEQSIGRVSGELSGSHPQPWYFYLIAFPWMALPWLPFFAASAFVRAPEGGPAVERQALSLWWSWWVTTFVFFSLAAGKLEIYLLPLFPAMALITACFWERVLLARQIRGVPHQRTACSS